MKQVKNFLNSTSYFLLNLEVAELKPFEEELINSPSDESVKLEDVVNGSLKDDSYYEEEDESDTPLDLPETVILPLSSNITSVKLIQALKLVIAVLRELRKGQANDALEERE